MGPQARLKGRIMLEPESTVPDLSRLVQAVCTYLDALDDPKNENPAGGSILSCAPSRSF